MVCYSANRAFAPLGPNLKLAGDKKVPFRCHVATDNNGAFLGATTESPWKRRIIVSWKPETHPPVCGHHPPESETVWAATTNGLGEDMAGRGGESPAFLFYSLWLSALGSWPFWLFLLWFWTARHQFATFCSGSLAFRSLSLSRFLSFAKEAGAGYPKGCIPSQSGAQS